MERLPAQQLDVHSGPRAHVPTARIIPSICAQNRLFWRTSHWNLVEQIGNKRFSCGTKSQVSCVSHLNLLDLMAPAFSRNEATPTVAEPSLQTPPREQWASLLSKS